MGSFVSKGRSKVSVGGSSADHSQSHGNSPVFVSFRGTDVRNTFFSHLHHSLIREGIPTYFDADDLQIGDEISPSLMNAIVKSTISIIIFSENYASSSWCMDELVEIMNLRKQGKLKVYPIFYKVEPREVRTPRFSFAAALADHEFKLGKDSDKLRRWREALSEASDLSGAHLKTNENEAEFIRKIVKHVNVQLDRTDLDVAKYPVGIESRVVEIKNLLNMESNGVLLVGLWGMAGVGKTTLAKAVFNDVMDQFDGCAFLPNIREDTVNPCVGLVKLQEKLLSEVLGRNDVTVRSVASGITRIKDRLCQKKVLLLLDDISSVEQLDALARELDWFGNGTRILVTTSDRSLLAAHDEHIVHKVEGLPHSQALQLLNKYAFPKQDKPNVAKDLIDRFLAYCAGLPLALVVLGSLLRNREECHWKSTLKLLEQQCPFEEINKVLRVSFDGLDHNLREILLVIACFFKGKCRRELEKAIEACGFQTSLGIKILTERSLITIVEDATCGSCVERVEMHPLLQSMCLNIVRQESPDEPGKRSWLQVYEDTNSVTSNAMGTNTVKGVALGSSHLKEVFCSANALTNLKKSRRLTLGNGHYHRDPVCFLHELHRMEWFEYSIPNTSFSWLRKFKMLDCVCCKGEGTFRHSWRGALDDDSWRNRKLMRSVVECQVRLPRQTIAKSARANSPLQINFIPNPYKCVC